jgi:hypothetical protein
MTIHQHPLSIIFATLFAAGIALAATPAPTPTPVPPVPPSAPAPVAPAPTSPTPPTTPIVETPAVAWLYGDSIPAQWLQLDYFVSQVDCEKAIATLHVTAPEEVACLEAGIFPTLQHKDYGSLTKTPGTK